MVKVTALVDIGLNWPAGQERDVEECRAAHLSNTGWAEKTPAPSDDPAEPSATRKSAKSATTKKAS